MDNLFPPHDRNFWADALSGVLRTNPTKWTKNFNQRIVNRFVKRRSQLQERLNEVVQGRIVPDIDDLNLGSGTQCRLAVLFLDICQFSARASWLPEEQKRVLGLMNLFMSEMISIVRDFDGHFEKNTGDGLMAYFGDGVMIDAERVKPAVEAATVMHYFNDHILGPFLDSCNVPPINFRIGIDVGPVTLARVGVKSANSDYNSMVAIGTIANVACKLMNLIPDGGICIGELAYRELPNNWNQNCTPAVTDKGFVFRDNERAYPAWILNYRLSEPMF